jgi:hypothetical protein
MAAKNNRVMNHQHELNMRRQRERSLNTLRPKVAYCLLSLFMVNTVSVLLMIFLVGLGTLRLSDTLVLTLVAETVTQTAAVFIYLAGVIFPK